MPGAVFLQAFKVIEVIDHQTVGLFGTFVGRIAAPVQPLHAGTVAQVETGHRVQRLASLHFLAQVTRSPAQQGFALGRSFGELFQVLPAFEQFGRGVFVEPGAQARYRRERDEHFEPGKLLVQGFDNALDERVAKAHAAQAVLRVADRIEDGGGGLADVDRCGLFVQQRRDAVRYLVHERDLHKNQGLLG